MTLRITNTLTRQKQAFVPLVEGQVSMYVCGVTVYDHCHVGHARVYVVFDVIARALRHLGYAVRYVRNFTDVDDKIIARANKNGESCDDLTNRFIAAFYEDMDLLGCHRPDVEPRVTTHMVEIVAMVQAIVDRGHAYIVAGEFGGQDVYFAIDDFAPYGALSGRSQDDNQAGASDRVTRDERKRNQADFALWKSAKPGEPAWDSPWGAGRPGWHIECSAMSCKHLGPAFDLHGGGKDLIFPHHENELAQSKAAHDAEFARYWLHNGFVTIDSEKMSKSLGNFFTIRDVLARFHPAVLRYYLLTAHYTQPLNFSDKSLEEASRRVLYIAERLAQAQAVAAKWKGLPVAADGLESKAAADLTEALQDDFNTPKVLAVLAELVASIGQAIESKDDALKRSVLIGGLSHVQAIAQVLGLFEGDPAPLAHEIVESARERLFPADSAQLIWVQELVQQRIAARATKDFAKADELRGELLRGGVEVRDTREGSLWRPLLGEV
ncbi:MAG: cysteine--tRNA ligase [Myxococcales bacterium]|nr:cysteine--tRNA ligase [Myxococcales bacterium]